MSDTGSDSAAREYPQNILDAATNGYSMDARMRFAMELMKHSPIMQDVSLPDVASTACVLADDLFSECEERGWIVRRDAHEPLPWELVKHAERMGEFQVHQQIGGQKAIQGAQGVVQPVRGKLNG